MNKVSFLVTSLICFIMLFSFNNQAIASEDLNNAEEISYKQEAQLELFNKLVKNVSTFNTSELDEKVEAFGDLFFDENDKLHFYYKESVFFSSTDLQQLVDSLRSNGIEVEATTYTYKDLFEQQMLIYQEIQDYYGDEQLLPTFSLVPDIFEGKIKFSYNSLDDDLLIQLQSKHSDILDFTKEEFKNITIEKSKRKLEQFGRRPGY